MRGYLRQIGETGEAEKLNEFIDPKEKEMQNKAEEEKGAQPKFEEVMASQRAAEQKILENERAEQRRLAWVIKERDAAAEEQRRLKLEEQAVLRSTAAATTPIAEQAFPEKDFWLRQINSKPSYKDGRRRKISPPRNLTTR